MNADPAVQLRLLDLQAADTALAQLAHRRRTLPELAEIATQQKAADAITTELVDAQTEATDIAAELNRLEADVDTVRARTARDEARLQAGGLPPKELEGLQHEIDTLARRQSNLEDDQLEVMERAEQAEAHVAAAQDRLAAVTEQKTALEARRDAAFADVDAALAQRTPERAEIAAELPADLVAVYEKARAQGGSGAALLRQRRCEGCRIELSGSELARVRSAAVDQVVRCDNCRAVLVRTAESGL